MHELPTVVLNSVLFLAGVAFILCAVTCYNTHSLSLSSYVLAFIQRTTGKVVG